MCCLQCIYLFLFVISVVSFNEQYPKRNCTNEGEPLLNLITSQGKLVQSIPSDEQLTLEHETPHFDVEPCDLERYRKNLKAHFHHSDVIVMKDDDNRLHLDPICGCTYVQQQLWRFGQWSTLAKQPQQRKYKDLRWFIWQYQEEEPFRYHISIMN